MYLIEVEYGMCYFSNVLLFHSVSSNLKEIFTAYLSSDLYLSGNLWALPLYVLAANNFRSLLASKTKKILLIPDVHVLWIRGSLSFLQQHDCSNRGSLEPFTWLTRSPPPQNRKRNVVAFCTFVLAGVMLHSSVWKCSVTVSLFVKQLLLKKMKRQMLIEYQNEKCE